MDGCYYSSQFLVLNRRESRENRNEGGMREFVQ